MRGVTANGAKIRSLRKTLGLTQESLAGKSQCDVKTIRRAEGSNRVDVETLRRVAASLAVKFREIIKQREPTPRQTNRKIADAWLAAFNARNPDAIADCFTEQGVLKVLADHSLPGAGEFCGKNRIREWAAISFETFLAEQITPPMCRVDAVGDYVFMRVDQLKLKCRRTGLETRVSVMWEFEITDGKISMLTMYPESGAIEKIYDPHDLR